MPVLVSRGRSRRTINEINMVPFIDVMLVLLIIFMVTAPMLRPGKVDLPNVGKSATAQPGEAVRLELRADGQMSLGVGRSAPVPVTRADLAQAVRNAQNGNAELPVLISADKNLKYADVMDIYGALKDAGVHRVALAGRPSSER